MVKFAFHICRELYALPYIKNIYQNEHEIFFLQYERWPTNSPQDLRLLESRYVSYEICQKRFETFFTTHRDVDGVNVIPQRKMGSLKFRKDAMLCTSPSTLIDDGGSKAKGFCSGDSGG